MGRVYLCCKKEIWYVFVPKANFCTVAGTNKFLRKDWQNKFQKTYVDIKSVELRGVLREVLKDVSGVGLREEKPTVSANWIIAIRY